MLSIVSQQMRVVHIELIIYEADVMCALRKPPKREYYRGWLCPSEFCGATYLLTMHTWYAHVM